MAELKVKDRVIVSTRVIPDPNQAYGRVEEIYPREYDDVVIVRLDNKELIKCFKSDVTVLAEKEPDTKTITITEDEFITLSAKVTNPKNFVDRLGLGESIHIGLIGAMICSNLRDKLFGDSVDND